MHPASAQAAEVDGTWSGLSPERNATFEHTNQDIKEITSSTRHGTLWPIDSSVTEKHWSGGVEKHLKYYKTLTPPSQQVNPQMFRRETYRSNAVGIFVFFCRFL